ncbi:MAG: N-acetylmuramoyl-L-alanine amidase [Gemmatimonadota bacterium]
MKWRFVLLMLTCAGCASYGRQPQPVETVPVPDSPEAQRIAELPPIPAVDGPLALDVGYPPEGGTIAVRDSNFIFGSTGSGRTQLAINGQPVQVAPNGGFLAFIPVPPNGVYLLQATLDGLAATLERRVNVPAPPRTADVADTGPRIAAAYPTGAWSVREGEVIEVGFSAAAGGAAAVLLPDGRRVPLVAQGTVAEARSGEQFRTDAAAPIGTASVIRYSTIVRMDVPVQASDTSVARPTIADVPLDAGEATFEYVAGADTVRTPLALNLALLPPDLPRVAVVAAPADAASDWTVRGRNDVAGPFHYFWPAGTRLGITGERNGMYRASLAGGRTVWVPAGDTRLLPGGAPPAGGAVGSVRLSPGPHWIDVRIPLPERMPFQVVTEERSLHIDVFGATSRVNFFQYGRLDPFVTFAEWSQPTDSVFRVSLELAEPVWGYDTFFDASGALVLRIRRPPAVDPAAPLRGLFVAVDPGHGGEDRSTRGPTGLTEADANLAISLRLRQLLEEAGARVMMTRVTDATIQLGDRPLMATDSGAHVLLSIHNNAFPDGVNPWANSGTSVYYFHRQSAPLARALQRELLQELGLRDIGPGRADLALARPTWLPAVLTETMFMMIPEQEAALRDPVVQDRIARAHLRALESFMRGRLQQ